MKSITQQIDSGLLKIGLYQMAGGIVGFALVIWAVFHSDTLSYALFFVSAMSPFFIFSSICGFMCLRTKKNALKYSLINQILQFAGISINGFSFKYIAGLALTVGIDLADANNSGINIGLPQFSFSINGDNKHFLLTINLVAAIFIYWILNLLNRQKEYKESLEVVSIGNQQ